MLAEMPVAALSLNELSRRVGLAKSNVLRYFESREDVLLELLSTGLRKWVEALDLSRVDPDALPLERTDAVASAVAQSLAERPVLCDLISAQAAVLERNVSTEAILRHKRSVNASVQILSESLSGSFPELDGNDVYQAIAITLLMTGGAWPHDRPTEALLAAYAVDAEIAAHQLSFGVFLQQVVAISLAGLLARRGATGQATLQD